MHMARWCDGGRTQRSRLGTLTDKAVKTAKRRVAEAALNKVNVGNEALDNVLYFEYLGSQLQGDGEDEADVRHRMDVAQAAFGSLSHSVERPSPVPCDEVDALSNSRVFDAHALV